MFDAENGYVLLYTFLCELYIDGNLMLRTATFVFDLIGQASIYGDSIHL